MSLAKILFSKGLRGKKNKVFAAGVAVAAFFIARGLYNQTLSALLGTALGLPFKAQHYHLKLSPLEVGIYNVEIGNPPGFSSPHMAEIPELFIRMEPADILKGRLHIRQVRFNLSEVVVERNTKNQINLREASKPRKPPAKAPQPGQDHPGQPKKPSVKPPQLLIDEVVFSLGTAQYVETTGGQMTQRNLALNVHELRLKNVTDPAQLLSQVVDIIIEKLGSLAVGFELKGLQQKAQQTVSDAIQAVSNWSRQFSG
ncbi:MAG TPA: AsmA family protein [Verrucomicrobiae bacterium]|jgi:hypothetical protein|nr:AsmA family protein [Verrucomicrobiae bacterium]